MNISRKVVSFSSIFLSVLLLISTVVASSEDEEECRSYAKEEQVPQEELSNYIEECLQYLQNPEQKTESSNEEMKEDIK